MINYTHLRQVCQASAELSTDVLELFLLPYAANKNNLDRQMIRHLSPFQHIVKKFEDELIHSLMAQYIAHHIFKKDGLIHRYLHHDAIKSLAPHKRQFLERQANTAARFSFSIITGNPAPGFYEMLDVFSEETYLLFSPGMSQVLQEQPISLWFNLIMYNGACYQNFGPIAPYRSFDADDIFFFATERRPEIETPSGIIEDVERNPVPYMMLLVGADYPAPFHKKNRLVYTSADYDLDSLEVTARFREHFVVEYSQGVYRLTLKPGTAEFPPAEAYYDEEDKVLVLKAMTHPAFQHLIHLFAKLGFSLDPEPTIRVCPSMIITSEEILRKKIRLVEYEHLFETGTSPRRANKH